MRAFCAFRRGFALASFLVIPHGVQSRRVALAHLHLGIRPRMISSKPVGPWQRPTLPLLRCPIPSCGLPLGRGVA